MSCAFIDYETVPLPPDMAVKQAKFGKWDACLRKVTIPMSLDSDAMLTGKETFDTTDGDGMEMHGTCPLLWNGMK